MRLWLGEKDEGKSHVSQGEGASFPVPQTDPRRATRTARNPAQRQRGEAAGRAGAAPRLRRRETAPAPRSPAGCPAAGEGVRPLQAPAAGRDGHPQARRPRLLTTASAPPLPARSLPGSEPGPQPCPARPSPARPGGRAPAGRAHVLGAALRAPGGSGLSTAGMSRC